MFDFRYHALSLVAVFLALAIGIVLGATAGDTVVSQAGHDLRSSLRGDLTTARRDARTARAELAERDRFIDAVFGPAVSGRLAGQRVALIVSGAPPPGLEDSAKQAVTAAGATVDSTSSFDALPNLPLIGAKLGGGFRALAGDDPTVVRPLAARIAHALVAGGGSGRRIEAALSDRVSGAFKGATAVVLYRSGDQRDDPSSAFEAGLLDGLRATHLPVVGVETLATTPSQVGFYQANGMASVDNLDLGAGRIALVLALEGASGSFGFKPTASAALPPQPQH